MTRRFLVEDSCEHGFFGKHVTDYDPAGNTYCLTKPVVVTTDELLAMLVAEGVLRVEPIAEMGRFASGVVPEGEGWVFLLDTGTAEIWTKEVGHQLVTGLRREVTP